MSRRSHTWPFVALALMAAAPPATTTAKTFEPTRKDDPAPNACKPDDCSLREAVIASNNRDGKDTISLRNGVYRLQIPAGGMFAEDRIGDLDLEDRTTIEGRGPQRTEIRDETDSDRVLQLGNAPSTLSGLAVRLGNARNGGGIYVGPLKATLDNVLVEANAATEKGGGIFTQSSNLTIARSTVQSNNAGESGGGLASTSADVTPHTTIQRSTIFFNATAGVGGGLGLAGPPPMTTGAAPVVDVVNSTLSTNRSDLNGGGISATFGGAEANLRHVTVADNIADEDRNDSGEGGGLHEFGGEINSFGSIIARNGAPDPDDPGAQCLGDFVGTESLLQNQAAPSGGCFPSIGFTMTDDAKLAVLIDDNGGPTLTHALETGSPAIGLSTHCPRIDQRGKQRPETGCDAGAFERKSP